LLEMNRKRLAQRAVENGVSGLVGEIGQHQNIFAGESPRRPEPAQSKQDARKRYCHCSRDSTRPKKRGSRRLPVQLFIEIGC